LNPDWVNFVEEIREYNGLTKDTKILMFVVSRDATDMIKLFAEHNEQFLKLNVSFKKIYGNIAYYKNGIFTGKFDRNINSSNKWEYINTLEDELNKIYTNLKRAYVIDGEGGRLLNPDDKFDIVKIKDPGFFNF